MKEVTYSELSVHQIAAVRGLIEGMLTLEFGDGKLSLCPTTAGWHESVRRFKREFEAGRLRRINEYLRLRRHAVGLERVEFMEQFLTELFERMRISEVPCVEMMMEISDEQAIESFECL